MSTGRQNVRIKDSLRVHWSVENGLIQGEGTIVDLSAKGMQLMTDKTFELTPPCVLLIEALPGGAAIASKKFKVLWFNKVINQGRESIQCGGEIIS
ncbi:MAG: hypothetical protein WCH62_07775 [Candidatus Omnitrophota bacterium]